MIVCMSFSCQLQLERIYLPVEHIRIVLLVYVWTAFTVQL